VGRYDTLRQIEQLDPERDHVRIYHLSSGYDFSWDTVRALELALYRTYCVPSISALLDRTGEFQHRAQKRYDDTSLIVAEISEWGYDSERGRAALRRMNQIHGRFQISNDDFLYVLSTFVFVPVRWIEHFGWRRYTERERLATFYFWREVGRRMAIKELPATYEEFERFSAEYERKYFRFAETNQRVGAATRELFVSWFPGFLAPVVRRSIHAMLDETMLRAFGFPDPGSFLRGFVAFALRTRGRLIRLLPPRRKAHFITHDRNRTYPRGYEIAELGPPAAVREEVN
jgi:hypothetical protein